MCTRTSLRGMSLVWLVWFHVGVLRVMTSEADATILAEGSSSQERLFPWPRDLIEQINGNTSLSWNAVANPRFIGYSAAQASALCGVRSPPAENLGDDHKPPSPWTVGNMPSLEALPDEFDSRSRWPGCIGEIVDQGACGSCWAVAAAECISDRLCVAKMKSLGIRNLSAESETPAAAKFVKRSAIDIMSCNFEGEDMGCLGGLPADAWAFAQTTGVATDACQPYAVSDGGPIPACPPGAPNPCTASVVTPMCQDYCSKNGSFPLKAVADDRVRLHSSYKLGSNEATIRANIFRHGPVEASFDIFADFLTYGGGVYTHVTGDFMGNHAVKILGWGKSEQESYWLVANSWGTAWGTEGFFKIRRGSNECQIEATVVAGDATGEDDTTDARVNVRNGAALNSAVLDLVAHPPTESPLSRAHEFESSVVV